MDKLAVEASPPTAFQKKKVPLPKIILMGIPYKCRMFTPFTSDHPRIGRFGRGIVNIGVLYLIWLFSGMICDVGDSLPRAALYFISFGTCFILARVFTIALKILMFKTNHLIIRIIKYTFGMVFIFLEHVLIIFFTVHMQTKFFTWGMICIIMLFKELVIWETLQMCFQVPILLFLQRSKLGDSGVGKFLQMLVAPPLFSRVIRR